MLGCKNGEKGLAAGDFLWYLLYTIVIVGFLSVYYYFIIAPTDINVEGYEFAMGKVQANSVMTEVLASPDCLSTGEMAVLSEDKLNERDENEVLDCAYHPSVWTYLKVEDHEKNTDYEFGDSRITDLIVGDITEWEIPVTIDTGSGKNLGTATFSMLHPPHFAASATRAGNIAWHEGDGGLDIKVLTKKHGLETTKGRSIDDLEILAKIRVFKRGYDYVYKATMPFKGYSFEADFGYKEDKKVPVRKEPEGYIEIKEGDSCTYSPYIGFEVELYHGEIKERLGFRDLCCDDGEIKKCGLSLADHRGTCAQYVCMCGVGTEVTGECGWYEE